MNRDEYLAMLDTAPATPMQIGAIIAEFDRLGVYERSERLTITAALLELDELGSSRDLVMGDAGRLVRMLRDTRDRSCLPEVTAVPGSLGKHQESPDGTDTGQRVTFAAAIRDLIALVAIMCGIGRAREPSAAAATRQEVGEEDAAADHAVTVTEASAAKELGS